MGLRRANAFSAARNRVNGSIEAARRTTVTTMNATMRSFFSTNGTRKNLRHRSIADLDQSRRRKVFDQDGDIVIEPGRLNVVLGENTITKGIERRRLLDDLPDSRADPVEGIVRARIQMKDHRIADKVARHLVFSHMND